VNTELSSEAKRLIDAARGFDDATADDRVRVQERLFTQLAAGAALSTTAGSTHAVGSQAVGAKAWAARTFAGALPKAAVGTAAAAAVAVGVALSWPNAKVQVPAPQVSVPRAAVPASAAPAEAPAAPAAAPAVAPPVAIPATPATPAVTPEEMASPGPAAVAERPAAARPAPAPRQTKIATPEAPPRDGDTSGNLDEELRLVSAARAALKLGEGAAALQRLVEYQQRFPAGALTVEAQALRVDALCAAGDRAASAEAAEAFLKRWPESPLSARVRAACQ
jgi:hypothetical protein